MCWSSLGNYFKIFYILDFELSSCECLILSLNYLSFYISVYNGVKVVLSNSFQFLFTNPILFLFYFGFYIRTSSNELSLLFLFFLRYFFSRVSFISCSKSSSYLIFFLSIMLYYRGKIFFLCCGLLILQFYSEGYDYFEIFLSFFLKIIEWNNCTNYLLSKRTIFTLRSLFIF